MTVETNTCGYADLSHRGEVSQISALRNVTIDEINGTIHMLEIQIWSIEMQVPE